MRVLSPIATPSGFRILPIHYSHDPEKGQGWYDSERPKFSQAAWDRDYEINFASQLGKPCYTKFGIHHVVHGLTFNPGYPIDLCMDFNFTPMSWTLGQVQNGWECLIDELTMDGADIGLMVDELRNRLPAWQAGFHVYGDASGKANDAHAGKSYYQLFEIAMRGYPGARQYRVPAANPTHGARVGAVNLRLEAPDGRPGVKINAHMTELITDLGEVVWGPGGKILESHDPKNPYYRRGHMSAAWGYRIAREWPIARDEDLRPKVKPKPKVKNESYARMGRAD